MAVPVLNIPRQANTFEKSQRSSQLDCIHRNLTSAGFLVNEYIRFPGKRWLEHKCQSSFKSLSSRKLKIFARCWR